MKLPSSSRHWKLIFTAKTSLHCTEKSEARARCWSLNEPTQLCSERASQRLELSEAAKLYWNLRLCFYQLTWKIKRGFSASLPVLPQIRHKPVFLSLSLQEQGGAFTALTTPGEKQKAHLFQAGNPKSPPKSTMGRWAPLPHTPALRTGSFGFYLVQSCKKM